VKTFRPHVLAAAIAAVGLTVAACGSSGTAATPQTETVTVTAEADPAAPAEDDATAPADTDMDTESEGRAESEDAATPGAGCDLSAGTRAIVVQGLIDCDTVDAVWSEAVAAPGFSDRSSRTPAGDFLCRPHQLQPIQTGYCETDQAPYTGFKVIRGGGHHGGHHGGR